MKKELRQCFARVLLSCKRPLRYPMYNRCPCEFTLTHNPLKLPAKKISITVKSQAPAFDFVKKKQTNYEVLVWESVSWYNSVEALFINNNFTAP